MEIISSTYDLEILAHLKKGDLRNETCQSDYLKVIDGLSF